MMNKRNYKFKKKLKEFFEKVLSKTHRAWSLQV